MPKPKLLKGPKLTPSQKALVDQARERFERVLATALPGDIAKPWRAAITGGMERAWLEAGPSFASDAEAIAAFRGCCALAIAATLPGSAFAIAQADVMLARKEGWLPDPKPVLPQEDQQRLNRELWGEEDA